MAIQVKDRKKVTNVSGETASKKGEHKVLQSQGQKALRTHLNFKAIKAGWKQFKKTAEASR